MRMRVRMYMHMPILVRLALVGNERLRRGAVRALDGRLIVDEDVASHRRLVGRNDHAARVGLAPKHARMMHHKRQV